MGNGDKISLSLEEIGLIKQVAVQEAKLDILVADFQATRKSTDENIVKIFEASRTFPDKMTACKEQLEGDIHNELEKHYVTVPRIDALEVDINNRFDRSDSRSKWTIGAIVSVAGVVQFFTTMYFMGLQIAKLSGGG